MKSSLAQRAVAECLGTAFLLAAVVGSGIMAARLAGGNGALALLADDVEPVFAKIAQDHADGVVRGTSGGLFFSLRARIGAAAIAHKLPLITYDANEMPYGPLLSYGPDFSDQVHRAVSYVDKILKGADPADLPVEQPTRLPSYAISFAMPLPAG